MTPKEKALQICQRMGLITFDKGLNNGSTLPLEVAKEFALIAVDEILEVIIFNKYDDKYWEEEEYWQGVKQEMELL